MFSFRCRTWRPAVLARVDMCHGGGKGEVRKVLVPQASTASPGRRRPGCAPSNVRARGRKWARGGTKIEQRCL